MFVFFNIFIYICTSMTLLEQIKQFEIDIQLLHYLRFNSSIDINQISTSAHKFYQRKFWNRDDIDSIIPLVKHKERLDILKKAYDELYTKQVVESEAWDFYKTKLIPTFQHIQSNGLYTYDGTEYTNYNVFTRTGRPSNSNNGINYAALNKMDGSRRRYRTRYETGRLFEFDYDAYHLRLICNLVGYEAPTESFHTHMAKIYFNKEDISDEEYEISKQISFKILYGGVDEKSKQLEFYKLTDEYIKSLWKLYNKQGWIETPIAKRRFYKSNFKEMTPQKLFNYLIQAYETEQNVVNIQKVFDVLGDGDLVILYTYDSILIDVQFDDTYIVDNVKSTMGMLTKCSSGKNYNAMNSI